MCLKLLQQRTWSNYQVFLLAIFQSTKKPYRKPIRLIIPAVSGTIRNWRRLITYRFYREGIPPQAGLDHKKSLTVEPIRLIISAVSGTIRNWRRLTLPHFTAVPSARVDLTSLFGMGRGGPHRHSHHKVFSSCKKNQEPGIRLRPDLVPAIDHEPSII